MSKYLDRLNQDEKAAKGEQAKLAEAHARESVKTEISKLKSSAATLQAAYNQALGANPFNVNRVFQLTAEIEANKGNLAIAEKILAEEFGAE